MEGDHGLWKNFLTHTNTYNFHLSFHSLSSRKHIQRQIERGGDPPEGALREMPIITVHLLSIPTQSEVTQKALSGLTSCSLESSSSFFCWLRLSVAVWVRRCLITLLSNKPIFRIYVQGGDVPARCHSKMQLVHMPMDTECSTP